jgi:MFS superfamily sulfate permease-like transporter
VYGLFTAFVPVLIYSLLGTSRYSIFFFIIISIHHQLRLTILYYITYRQLAVGPEALISILVGAAISEKSGLHPPSTSGDFNLPNENVNMLENIAIANMLGLMVGLFTFLLGFFRLGFLDSVLSRALLRGFVTAVALVVSYVIYPP